MAENTDVHVTVILGIGAGFFHVEYQEEDPTGSGEMLTHREATRSFYSLEGAAKLLAELKEAGTIDDDDIRTYSEAIAREQVVPVSVPPGHELGIDEYLVEGLIVRGWELPDIMQFLSDWDLDEDEKTILLTLAAANLEAGIDVVVEDLVDLDDATASDEDETPATGGWGLSLAMAAELGMDIPTEDSEDGDEPKKAPTS